MSFIFSLCFSPTYDLSCLLPQLFFSLLNLHFSLSPHREYPNITPSNSGLRISHPLQAYLPFWTLNVLSAIALKRFNYDLISDNANHYRCCYLNSHSKSSPSSAYRHNIFSCTWLGLSVIIPQSLTQSCSS